MFKMKHHLFSLLLLLLLSLISFAFSSFPDSPQPLLSFKASLPNPSLLSNWLPNQNPCSFSHITCSQTSLYYSIDLSFIPLVTNFTTLSLTLLSLTHLQSLNLKHSNLSGSIIIPPHDCTASLTTLDLSMNQLSGSLSDISYLNPCSGLKSLNVSHNGFVFSPKDSDFLKLKLQSLDFSFNSNVSGTNVMPWILSPGCDDLQVLALRGNKVSGEVDFSKCHKLHHLDMSANNISAMMPSFGECSSLEYLDISANKYFGDIGFTLAPCKKLKHVNASFNGFSGEVPTSFPVDSIEFLYLAGNRFRGEIPEKLLDLCGTLVELDLSMNSLSGVIPRGFTACDLLELLDVSKNGFSGELPVEIFMEMSSLRKLVLSFNGFAGELPENLSKLMFLETLDLSSNNFSGGIPGGLCESPRNNLQELFLQNNKLTGLIPDTLSNCSQLVSLDLSVNFLKGTIPSSLGSLSKLRDLIMWFNHLEGEIPQELMYIKTLENLILDFNELTGGIPSGLRNCTNLNWISFANNRMSGEIPAWIGELSNLAILKLSNNSFYGRIPKELGDCRSLIWLDLNTNSFNGSIPPELFKQSGKISLDFISGKTYAYVKNDGSDACHGAGNLLEFAGISSKQLNIISTRNPCNFTRVYQGNLDPHFRYNGSILFLDLSYNKLSGTIPKEIGSLHYANVLNLGHNNLSGDIPEELGNDIKLDILDLSWNRLKGQIPQSLTGLSMLSELQLSNNLLWGPIPDSGQFVTFSTSNFVNNTGLCGYPLPPCGGPSGSSADAMHKKSRRRQASLAGSLAMGLLFSLFCIFGVVIIVLETRKRRKNKEAALDAYMENHSHSGNNTNWKLTSAREALSINLAAFEKPIRKLTFADLLEATNGFHNDSLIGSGGFGDVYKAQLKDKSVVAIKKLIHISGQGDREFMAEMETIGKIKHRNLVALLGYCKVGDERLLVYEFMKYGSLEDVLHDRKKAGVKLNWAVRRKIAIGAARGLAFLHHNCIPHIIHRDMKSSNVLLDENLESRVSDFGMARLMSAVDTHLSVSTLAGTPGYVPPEYYQSFRCSTKGDVYSYGVVLLELLTGRRPTDSVDFGDNNNLVGWVKQHVKMKVSEVFDPELLKEDASLEGELQQHLKVALACLDDRPWRRPTMIQVMAMFKEIQAGSGIDSQSTIDTEDNGGFGSVEMVNMSIKEAP